MNWIHTWHVKSTSRKETYSVSMGEDGTFGCGCPAWKFRREVCKHIKYIWNTKLDEIKAIAESKGWKVDVQLSVRDKQNQVRIIVSEAHDSNPEKRPVDSTPTVLTLICENAEWRVEC